LNKVSCNPQNKVLFLRHSKQKLLESPFANSSSCNQTITNQDKDNPVEPQQMRAVKVIIHIICTYTKLCGQPNKYNQKITYSSVIFPQALCFIYATVNPREKPDCDTKQELDKEKDKYKQTQFTMKTIDLKNKHLSLFFFFLVNLRCKVVLSRNDLIIIDE
jgi:hypothetical protein